MAVGGDSRRLGRYERVEPGWSTIDGTRDYLRGRPGWSVSVALVEDRVPSSECSPRPFATNVGRPCAAVRPANGDRLKASDRTALPGARVPAEQLPDADADLVAVAKPNSIALRIALVAAGEADLVATLKWGFEWDIAAAALIAEEAGAVVTGALGQPLAFNTASGHCVRSARRRARNPLPPPSSGCASGARSRLK